MDFQIAMHMRLLVAWITCAYMHAPLFAGVCS